MFADNWCLKANERVFGPYTSEQLRKFAHEGRFSPASLVAPAGSRDWREARGENAFASFFGAASAANADGRAAKPNEPRRPKPFGGAGQNHSSTEQTGQANFVLVFDVVSAAASRIEPALHSLGSAFRLAENVWAVNCALTAIGVRNAVAPYLRPNESLFVVDATNGRTSWQNYAPEAHSKISAAFVHGKR
ncbi:MAG TPA: hypothetical protein DEA50_09870 [Parvularcula sp.]|nr:hypothetical protein [Parvularcula sp.]